MSLLFSPPLSPPFPLRGPSHPALVPGTPPYHLPDRLHGGGFRETTRRREAMEEEAEEAERQARATAADDRRSAARRAAEEEAEGWGSGEEGKEGARAYKEAARERKEHVDREWTRLQEEEQAQLNMDGRMDAQLEAREKEMRIEERRRSLKDENRRLADESTWATGTSFVALALGHRHLAQICFSGVLTHVLRSSNPEDCPCLPVSLSLFPSISLSPFPRPHFPPSP